MKKIWIFIFICAMYITGNAQVSTKNSCQLLQQFHSFNTIQVLNGSSTTSLAINTVNGFQFNKLFAGVGVGFDYYYHTTIPLFLEGRFDLVKSKLQLFADGGVSFPFSSQNTDFETKSGTYKTAGMWGAGVDYLVTMGKDALVLGAGFSNKQVIQMIDNNIWNPVLNRVENSPSKDQYSLNRITIRIGWRF